MSEQDILDLIARDSWRMQALKAAESMHLPDWMIGAGFVRNKVWDHVHGYSKDTPPSDIDLVYFDKEEKFNNEELGKTLDALVPGVEWQVKNQVHMHDKNDEAPYTSTEDAISKWPETATAVGVKLENGKLKLIAPHGIDDLINVVARPTPAFATDKKRPRVQERIEQKRWKERWPKLVVAT